MTGDRLMTPPRKPRPRTAGVTRPEIDRIKGQIDALDADNLTRAAMQKETHAMMLKMYRALIEPSPAYDGSLIDALTELAINVKSGQRVAGWAVIWAKWLSAAAVISASLYALTQFGPRP